MSGLRDRVADALTADIVAQHYGIEVDWRGARGRARRCPHRDHKDRDMTLHRRGSWQCYACDDGGDLFHLIAAFERLDTASDFPAVLEIAAAIAGVDNPAAWDKSPPPRPMRPPPPQEESPGQRLLRAQQRAAWLWDRLGSAYPTEDEPHAGTFARRYLAEERGLDIEQLRRIAIRTAPALLDPKEIDAIAASRIAKGQSDADIRKLFAMWRQNEHAAGICVPVLHKDTGAIIDVRCRRFNRGHGPKVIGMVGGISSAEGQLLGCYGAPHALAARVVVIVEGLVDTLTACQLWPDYDVLGATDAARYPLVAAHAAEYAYRTGAQIVLVMQDDGAGGAAEDAVDVGAVHVIARTGREPVWLECAPHKDLNAWHLAAPGAPQQRLQELLGGPRLRLARGTEAGDEDR